MPAYRRKAEKLVELSSPLMPHQWTREKQFDLDEINYDICVAKHAARFWAVAVCNTCCEQVSINLGSSTAQEAQERAIVGMQLHHDSVHCVGRKFRE